MKKKVDEKGIVYLEQPQIPTLSLIISLFSLLLISLGTFSIFATQAPLETPQSTTSQAVVQGGPVSIATSHSPDQLAVHQLNTIDLKINTTGIQTQGTTLVFNIITNTTDVINVETISTSNLRATSQEVQKTSDGFLVKSVAVPAGTGPFSTTTPTAFLRITFNPHSAGLFRLAFDQDYSHVYLVNSHEEILGKIPQMDYTILADKGNACNQSCSSNNDCAVNLRCYNGACRSATNLTSDSCSTTSVITQVACNQGCANSSQCANGNYCFENRCRAPGNPDSTVCARVTQVTYTSIVKACNVSCTSNKECAVNLRCYNGACRLATNPSSTSCTPSNVASVSYIYNTPAPAAQPAKGSKGEEIVIPTPAASPAVKPTASPTVKPVPSATPNSTSNPFVWPTPIPATMAAVLTPSPTPKVTPTPVATEPSLMSKIQQMFAFKDISFPLIAVISGVVLLIISLLLLLTKRGRKLPNVESGSALKPTMYSKQPTTQEQSLEQRIAELKTAQNKPDMQFGKPAEVKPTMHAAPNQAQAPAANNQPKEKVALPPSTLTVQAPNQPPAPPMPASSTMLDRMKYKGVMDKMPENKQGSSN